MTAAESASAVVERLATHPHLAELTAHVRALALRAAEAQDTGFAQKRGDGLAAPDAPPVELSFQQAETPLGNVLELLENGAKLPSERLLLSALLALGISGDLPSAPESELKLAGALLWLAAHTPADAFSALDVALGPKAGVLWQALSRIAADPSLGAGDFGRADALLAAALLSSSGSDAAAAALSDLVGHTSDPLLSAMRRSKDKQTETLPTLSGELTPAPHGPVLTALLTVTLLLFAVHFARLVARVALAYRHPARLRLSDRGLELDHHSELLGKVVRQRATFMPLENLARVTREVRYARIGMYAGLLALVLGSYFGVGLLVDGMRVPGSSPPLLGLAVLFMVLGLAVDFGLSALSNEARGKCRVIVVPRKGRTLCISALDPKRADLMLSSLAAAREPLINSPSPAANRSDAGSGN